MYANAHQHNPLRIRPVLQRTHERPETMTVSKHRKVTQATIAELAGVSQATVSLVLNGKADAASRIPEETRRRVLEVIQQTTYVADPAARRLAGVGNKIVGVFTYEPAFPTEGLDFYTPLLSGIEAAAEETGNDLLMFTSAPVVDGHRRIFHENNRLGLADGCLLLGLEMDGSDLARLVDEGYPFVAVGRREAEGVPYVGVDYVSGTRELVERALVLGHDRFFYLHVDSSGESVLDRLEGFHDALENGALDGTAVVSETRASTGVDLASDWAAIQEFGPSVLFVESPSMAEELVEIARVAGVSVPDDMSMVTLGEQSRQRDQATDFTRFSAPRTELGARAVLLLSRILSKDDQPGDDELRVLLTVTHIQGSTLVAASR